MDLVNELQISAEQDDVLTLLRKTKRLAAKLRLEDIGQWLRSELEGYDKSATLPLYRRIRATIAMNPNGYIPDGFGMVSKRIRDLPELGVQTMPLRDSISTVLSMIDNINDRKGIFWTVQGDDAFIRKHFDPLVQDQLSFLFHLDQAQVRAIPEQIKDKVLDWACALEAAGVKGEGMSFSPNDKEVAHAITFNIYGSHIEQLNNLGTNKRNGP